MQVKSLDGDAHSLYELAKARDAAGQSEDARVTYAEFEKLASKSGNTSDASRLDLILMYAGSPATTPNALKLAQQEIAARQDVWTLDAYAWALYVNGRYEDADTAIQKAMTVGIQSSAIFDHAGHIARKLNRDGDASRYFTLCLQSNPTSEYASDARRSLASAIVAATGEQQALPTVVAPPAEVRHDPATNADPSKHNPASVVVQETTTATPTFVPVPVALLLPRPHRYGATHTLGARICRSQPGRCKSIRPIGSRVFPASKGDWRCKRLSTRRAIACQIAGPCACGLFCRRSPGNNG